MTEVWPMWEREPGDEEGSTLSHTDAAEAGWRADLGFRVTAGCFGGRAGVGPATRGTLLRSCPPSACGLLLLILRCEESPEPPGLRMASRRTTFAGEGFSIF
jgi:hypothetical protein